MSEKNATSPAMRKTNALVPLPKWRVVLLIMVGVAVVLGTLSAINRSSLGVVTSRAPFADVHGPLMIFGFLGTAISLERAVAFQTGGATKPRWGFVAPALGVLGSICILTELVFGVSTLPGTALGWWVIPGVVWTTHMIALSCVYVAIWKRQHSISVLIQLLAAIAGVLGAFIWAYGVSAARATPWWLIFLVLSIIGERLELSHVAFVAPWVEPALIGLSITNLVSLCVLYFDTTIGYVALGVNMGFLLCIMLYNDTAIRTFKLPRFTGFMGRSMLLAYFWGLTAALIWIFVPVGSGSLFADVAIHAIALGFTVSMVIAHVSIIVPAITRRGLPYSPVFFLPLLLLNAGVLLRLIGAIINNTLVWKSGDLVSIIAVFALMLCIIGSAVWGVIRRRRSGHRNVSRSVSQSAHHRTPIPTRHETHSRIGRKTALENDPVHAHLMTISATATTLTVIVTILCIVISTVRPDLAQHSSLDTSHTSSSTVASGRKITLTLVAHDMSFNKKSFTVSTGDDVTVTFINNDSQSHNVVFSNGVVGKTIGAHQSTKVRLGVLTKNTEGWCSLPGHKQMGMDFWIYVTGSTQNSQTSSSSATQSSHLPTQSELKNYAQKTSVHSAVLPQPSQHDVTFTIHENTVKITDNFAQKMWQYNDSTPAPTIRGTVGDTFHVTVKNETHMEHNVDFHAGLDGNPQNLMGLIKPGKSRIYTFTAQRMGIWLYHCSNMPMSQHMANGMIGAVIIEPKDGLAQVDHEYVLVQSDQYLSSPGGTADTTKLSHIQPDIVSFNGRAYQYDAHPLDAKVGERVRFWILNAGPNIPLAFHIVGAQFDTIWKEGAYTVNRQAGLGSQTLDLMASQGGFVETVFSYPGDYTFLNHIASYAEKGAHGIIHISEAQ
ncbi:multicopper oxidase domain-containing protein [Alloscardovia venturai]